VDLTKAGKNKQIAPLQKCSRTLSGRTLSVRRCHEDGLAVAAPWGDELDPFTIGNVIAAPAP
jgi:hypothetical protein